MRKLTLVALASAFASLAAATLAPDARAGDLVTPTGGKGQFVFDQLGGFRTGRAPALTGTVSYAGVLGVSYDHYQQANALNTQLYDGYSYTSFWLAPSIDYFVIDHLSIGGLVEISTTSRTHNYKDNPNAAEKTDDLGSTTNFTVYPRVGYMFAIGNRFGIWPRVGAGFAYFTSNTGGGGALKYTYTGFLATVDVGFILRINESFYVKLAPEFSYSPGSTSVSSNLGNQSQSVSASDFNVSAMGGFGVFL